MREYNSHMLNKHSMAMYTHCMLFYNACSGAFDGNKDSKRNVMAICFKLMEKHNFLRPSMPVTVPFIALDTILFLHSHRFPFIVFNMQHIRRYIFVLILLLIRTQHKMKSHAGCWLDVDWNRQWHRRLFLLPTRHARYLFLCCVPIFHIRGRKKVWNWLR